MPDGEHPPAAAAGDAEAVPEAGQRRGWPVAERAASMEMDVSVVTYGPPWFTLGYESSTRVRRQRHG